MFTFKRQASDYLKEWKQRDDRKPLLLRGARQVGKTTLVEQFARKNYKHYILLNLEKPEDRFYFDEYDNVKTILESLFLKYNITTEEINDTLLFLDEIQESPRAIQLLRYFYEEFPGLHVIAAGSLLEFAMKKVKSFPVGRIEYLYMHPLNFVEFLEAFHHSEFLKQLNSIPVKPFAHSGLLGMFNRYAIIGGMPEILSRYLKNENIADLPKVYESIWGTYQNDVEKYASNETERKVIKHIVSTAHLYLDKRIKFQNFGRSNYRSREVSEAFQSLDQAKIIRLIYPTTDVEVPLIPDLRKSPRLQFLDTGILNYINGIQTELLPVNDLSPIYKGNLVAHIITQELISINTINDKKPNFWVREKKQSSAEVDLVFSYGDKVIPIEIKSGKTGTLKSLHQFVEQAPHPYAVRMYAGKFSIERTKTPGGKPFLLMNLPYYLGTKIPEYLDYFISKYQL
jgi:predicted AAA+ superfamily ATPase